jgi:glc operon protein GlcG
MPIGAILRRPWRSGGYAWKTRINTVLGFTLAVVMFAATASAQQAPSPPPTTPYGAPIGLEAAKKVMAAAEAEATKNNWAMAIIILDSTGHAVMLHKFDNTQYGSIGVAEDKARSRHHWRVAFPSLSTAKL